MLVHHLATAADWELALQTGAYTTSTLGVTLAQEGFVHCCRPEQVGPVYDRYYRDVTQPLLLLTVDTDLLAAPWREDPVGDDTYPHVYGPIDPAAVVDVRPYPPA